MKPVVPIPLSKARNLITRTIIPVIQTPELAPGINGMSGLGDIQESLFFSPNKWASRCIYFIEPAKRPRCRAMWCFRATSLPSVKAVPLVIFNQLLRTGFRFLCDP